MIEIRKTITLRETVFSELGVEPHRPTTRAVGMVVIRNPFAGQFVEDPTAVRGRCDAGRAPHAGVGEVARRTHSL
jgi:amino acid synthesis protein